MIEEKIKIINDRIAAACCRVGSDPRTVVLLAVTKTVSVENIQDALRFGIRHIGESRVQEALAKFPALKLDGVSKHLIGHLQTNKAKKAVELFDVIQSLDRLELAREIDRHAKASGKTQECYIEIKVSQEDTKFGLPAEEAEDFLNKAKEFGNINITGVMAMAPYFDDPGLSRPYFRRAGDVFKTLKGRGLKTLSMGMSGDFEVAVEEGSNMVRVGTALFK